MRKILLLGASSSLLVLSGCGFAAGMLAGSSVWGDGPSWGGLDDEWALSSFQGTSVVCLGADQDVENTGLFEIRGTVLNDRVSNLDVGNVIPCEQEPARILSIEDEDGVVWEVGYAWYTGDGWDSTPAVNAWRGDYVELVVRQGDSAGTAAGFAVYEPSGLLYAMEAGHGEVGLADGDVDSLQVETRAITELDDGDECTDSVSQNFTTDTDELILYPGDDAGLEIDGEYFVTCNIASFEVQAGCDDQVAESSWVIFR